MKMREIKEKKVNIFHILEKYKINNVKKNENEELKKAYIKDDDDDPLDSIWKCIIIYGRGKKRKNNGGNRNNNSHYNNEYYCTLKTE